jgi:hypothetical protein
MLNKDKNGMGKELEGLRERYNAPPETPSEEMWGAIQARMEPMGKPTLTVEEGRKTRSARAYRALRWATAAAAVLVVGVGVGRVTAPGFETLPEGAVRTAEVEERNSTVLRAAAVNHLTRTESLLTLVRADVRAGRVPPAMADWSRTLLSQTRLLMDAQTGNDPAMTELLEDLELVLVQIVAVTGGSSTDETRIRSEMNLALNGLEENEVLSRIQAVIPAGSRRFGT